MHRASHYPHCILPFWDGGIPPTGVVGLAGTRGSPVGIPPTFLFELFIYHALHAHLPLVRSKKKNNLVVSEVLYIETAHALVTAADQLNPHCPNHSPTATAPRLPLRRLKSLALSYLGEMAEPSWSAVERGNPPPRRKACSACIKSKRRCTLDFPACLRCVQRKIECNYPDASKHRPIRGTTHAPAAAQVETSPPVVVTATPQGVANPSDAVDLSVPLEIVPRETGSLTPPSWRSTSCSLTTPPAFPSDQGDPEAQLGDTSVNAPGLPANNAIQDVISAVIEARMKYAIQQLRAAVTQMALECSTPWSHPRLYEYAMPRCMQGR